MKDFANGVHLTLNENEMEDEYHVLFNRLFYEDLRKISLCSQCSPLKIYMLS